MNVKEAIVCANNYRDSKKRWGKLRYEIATSELVAIALVTEVERLQAELAAVKAEIENIVSGKIKANGRGDCE